jgi:hypothetical protein
MQAQGKKSFFVFGRNTLQIAMFWYFIVLHSFHPIHFQNHMTGESSVRGKVRPIWVRIVSIVFAPYKKVRPIW